MEAAASLKSKQTATSVEWFMVLRISTMRPMVTRAPDRAIDSLITNDPFTSSVIANETFTEQSLAFPLLFRPLKAASAKKERRKTVPPVGVACAGAKGDRRIEVILGTMGLSCWQEGGTPAIGVVAGGIMEAVLGSAV